MAVVLVKNSVSEAERKMASEDYGEYVKVVVDLSTGVTVIGGEWHADGEKKLLAQGSRQDDLWNGGVDLQSGRVETIALSILGRVWGMIAKRFLILKEERNLSKLLRRSFAYE